MRVIKFSGLIPKLGRKSLPVGNAEIAENLDLYGNHLRPIKLPRDTGEKLMTPCGEVFTGKPATVHRAGSVYVAWDKKVFTSVDWTKKLGDTTFLFVDDGVLWRQSAERILCGQCPIKVGICRPKDAVVTTEVIDQAGCERTEIPYICAPYNTCDNVEHPPVPVAYLFTYVNACGEESAHSKPSEVMDITWGDAVHVKVEDKNVPDNAVIRRWYRAVTDNEENAHWLKVGETPIDQTEFYDTNCPCDWACELSTENHDCPPDCLEGVAAIGDNLTVVWSNRHFWVSEHNFPHAYDLNNEYRLRYSIQGMYEITTRIEGENHYDLIAITHGLHYVIMANEPNQINIAEIQQRYKCYDNTACHGESEIIYSIKQGLVAISQKGEELLTGHLMTEYEWEEFDPRYIRLTYHDDRIYGFNDEGGFIFQLGSDKRREGEFVTHNVIVDMGFTDEVSPFLVFKNEHIYEWGQGELAIYDWKTHTEVEAGMWRPVACKIISPDFDNIMPRGHAEAKLKFDEWKRKFPNGDISNFFLVNKEFQQHYSYLVGCRPSVEIIIYADGKEYYRRTVSSTKPFLLPRKYKAIDWAIRVIGSLRIEEIHLQASRESLLGSR